MVYDTGDPTEPLKKEWFEMQLRNKRWNKDLVGRTPSGANRCYAAEHVLEWQLLKQFIEADKKRGDESRCAHLYQYFLEEIPKASYKVKVAKNNGKLEKNNHFEYEEKDYSFDKWTNKEQDVPRAIDWICKYLGTDTMARFSAESHVEYCSCTGLRCLNGAEASLRYPHLPPFPPTIP